MSHLSRAQSLQCQQNGNNCKTCIGSNCNKKASFQTCRQCNSDTDSSCVKSFVYPSTNDTILDSNKSRQCKNYTDVCTTIAYHGGRTERGCHSELFEQHIDPSLQVHEDCTDTNCNDYVFPINRSVCYQCIGQNGDLSECNGVRMSQYQSICHRYDANDHCYAYVDSMCIWVQKKTVFLK